MSSLRSLGWTVDELRTTVKEIYMHILDEVKISHSQSSLSYILLIELMAITTLRQTELGP